MFRWRSKRNSAHRCVGTRRRANERTGGRLLLHRGGHQRSAGVLDASEIPPTCGVGQGIVIGIIAGGDKAIRVSVEHAGDDTLRRGKTCRRFIDQRRCVDRPRRVGRTPYVLGGVKEAKANGLVTGCVTCNTGSALAQAVDFPIEVVVGPEFVTGSTRMKSGTAQKLVLNMISTAVMIQLGRVVGNKMVDMQLTNSKLVGRGTRMIMEALSIDAATAEALLRKHGSVRKAIDAVRANR